MDAKLFFDILMGAAILVGIGAIIKGIYNLVVAQKMKEGIWYKIGTVLSSVFVALLCFGMAAFTKLQENKNGELLMANHPSGIESVTYGQALKNSCENMKWSFGNDENGYGIFIQMDGECIYDNKRQDIKIQFTTNLAGDVKKVNEKTPFIISFVGLNGAEKSYENDRKDIIYSMFKAYADEHNIVLDESAKDGILYTADWYTSDEDSKDNSDKSSDSDDSDSNNVTDDSIAEGCINYIKSSTPRAYPDITYGEAFLAFFGNPTWNYFESEEGDYVVDFTGECVYDGEDAEVYLQFLVNESEFTCYCMEINGEEQDEETLNSVLETVFSDYAEESGVY